MKIKELGPLGLNKSHHNYLVKRRQSQGRGSAWAEKQQNQLVDPSMLSLFPVFVCLSHLSHSLSILTVTSSCFASVGMPPKKPATLMSMALCSHLSYLS
ncbi:hypothetical protein ES319_A11G111900v1 [Gossypium barbadense]|uniref:Uncharacterized protein n=2 Tax=Gossypium TaxID=3633 RepID=A0A5J5TLW2_GOSBA|nr:hypothetical protein ES319_A11G111900v1 [Gossypium barbadense]TYG93560.1 hypothetical protein ES288_A11G119500v1 [Gossypium darwinii]